MYYIYIWSYDAVIGPSIVFLLCVYVFGSSQDLQSPATTRAAATPRIPSSFEMLSKEAHVVILFEEIIYNAYPLNVYITALYNINCRLNWRRRSMPRSRSLMTKPDTLNNLREMPNNEKLSYLNSNVILLKPMSCSGIEWLKRKQNKLPKTRNMRTVAKRCKSFLKKL